MFKKIKYKYQLIQEKLSILTKNYMSYITTDCSDSLLNFFFFKASYLNVFLIKEIRYKHQLMQEAYKLHVFQINY